MADPPDSGIVLSTLNWAYDRTIGGGFGLGSAIDLAGDYHRRAGSADAAARSLVNWTSAKAGTSGFVTGLGGLVTLPAAIPLNVASVLYLQIQMSAAIAHLGGYDIRSDQVRTLVFACMVGQGAADLLKDFGIKVGTRLAENLVTRIPARVIGEINQRIGMRLVTKFGTSGAINLGKIIPVVGGVVGGSVDMISTQVIGRVAISTFLPAPLLREDDAPSATR